ncbi:MAG: hypothetical protein ACXWOA_04265, partial [Isosphaeraceae bacterium]
MAAVSGVLGPVVANSLGLILWRPRPGRFSSEVRRKWIIRTLVEISEESHVFSAEPALRSGTAGVAVVDLVAGTG